MFKPGHPLHELDLLLEEAHARSEQAEDCVCPGCRRQRGLQEHGRTFAPHIIRGVMDRVIDLLGRGEKEPSELPAAYSYLPHVVSQLHSLEEVVVTIKSAVRSVYVQAAYNWARQNHESELYRDSQSLLKSLPWNSQFIIDVTPEKNAISGFDTPTAFIGNTYMLSYQLLSDYEENATKDAVGIVASNSMNLARLLSTCRKDLFMAIQEYIMDISHGATEQRVFVPYDPVFFTLVGSQAAGTRQLSLHHELIKDIQGDLHGMRRTFCPAIGRVMEQFISWQQSVYSEHFLPRIPVRNAPRFP